MLCSLGIIKGDALDKGSASWQWYEPRIFGVGVFERVVILCVGVYTHHDSTRHFGFGSVW